MIVCTRPTVLRFYSKTELTILNGDGASLPFSTTIGQRRLKMTRTYSIETTIEIEVSVDFDAYPYIPATRESPSEEAEVEISNVKIVAKNKNGSKLTDSLVEAITHDPDYLNTLHEICMDHASFDQERD